MKLGQARLSLVLALGSLLLVSPATASAQVTTADLVGTIKDSSGAVVPGVTVALTNEATGVSRSATTSGAGTTASRRSNPVATGSPLNFWFSQGGTHRRGTAKSINARRSTWLWSSGWSARASSSRAKHRCSKPNRPSSAA